MNNNVVESEKLVELPMQTLQQIFYDVADGKLHPKNCTEYALRIGSSVVLKRENKDG